MGSITQTGKAALEALGRRNTDQNAYASLNRFLAREGKYKATDLDFLTSGKEAINKWIDLDLQQREQAKKAGKPLNTSHKTALTPSESNSMSVREQKPVDNRATTKKSVFKGGVEPVRFTVRLADGAKGRKDIFLEKPFADALNVLIPDEVARKDWLVSQVRQSQDKNPASIIRCTIVNELLARVK